jgi:Fe-S-cluster containining protein
VIDGIPKSPKEWCPHVSFEKGCTIYESRPLPCQVYLCSWRMGVGSQRPDRIGMLANLGRMTRNELLSVVPNNRPEHFLDWHHCWEVFENRPGASVTAESEVEALRRSDSVLLAHRKQTKQVRLHLVGVKVFPYGATVGFARFAPSPYLLGETNLRVLGLKSGPIPVETISDP